MRLPYLIPAMLICASGLSGCSSMSAMECLDADWYERGQVAALQGLPVSEVLVQQNSCVQHGVVPDRRAFADGWRNAGHQTSAD